MSNDKKDLVVIETTEGSMTLEMWSDVAPETVKNFKKLADSGFYDSTAFHRIMDGFMIQGGCPNTKPGGNMALAGTGDPGYKIKAEFNKRNHVRGVISMARAQHPDSAGCPLFICTGEATFLAGQYTCFGQLVAGGEFVIGTGYATFLEGQYTCFGQLVEGDDVLEKIAKTPVGRSSMGEMSRPLKRVEVKSIRSKQ